MENLSVDLADVGSAAPSLGAVTHLLSVLFPARD